MDIPEPVSYDDDDVLYPDIYVKLTGVDGNAGSIMYAVTRALQHHRVPRTEIQQFRIECISGNYQNLLRTCQEWVNVS